MFDRGIKRVKKQAFINTHLFVFFLDMIMILIKSLKS